MAIKSVQATIKGTTYNLTLNSSTGLYEASVTAPSTSSYNNIFLSRSRLQTVQETVRQSMIQMQHLETI